jgi:hypothetical protein
MDALAHAVARSLRLALAALLVTLLAILVVPIGAVAWYVRRLLALIPHRDATTRRTCTRRDVAEIISFSSAPAPD